MSDRRLCKRCEIRWAQDGKYCRRCILELGPLYEEEQAARLDRKRPPRRQYTPPARPPVTLRDPLTGELKTFEIVFDGR